MKKILALLLALSMTAAFVSCGNKKEETKTDDTNVEEKPVINYNTEEDKAAAKAAVDGFLAGYCEFDVAKMSQYTNTDLLKRVDFTDYGTYISDKIRSYFTEEESTVVYAEEIGKLDTICKEAILNSASYEIVNAEYADTKWNFNVKTSNITLTDIFAILSSDKAAEITQQLIDELMNKLENPEITEEEIAAVAQDMLKASLITIVDLVTESCQTTEPKTSEYVVTAFKSGDKWLVDFNENGAQDILGSLFDATENN